MTTRIDRSKLMSTIANEGRDYCSACKQRSAKCACEGFREWLTLEELTKRNAGRVHVYTRTNDAHAWTYESTTNTKAAAFLRESNETYSIQTLLVPASIPALKWLDSCQLQADFGAGQ